VEDRWQFVSVMKIRLHCLLAALVAFAVGKSVAAEAPPKLVVTIVVDQLRYDYLERGREHFANEGFRLLMERGANMVFARFNYSPTVTGPGHASYLSGVGPAGHGILGNDWFDKRTGKDMYCCADTNVVAVGTTNKSAMSPRNFIGATVADQMRLHFNSKVISLSLKDRGAILPAGKKPAGAFWFDSKLGLFITSTYYMTNLPAWVSEFNDRKLPESYMEKTWERLHPTNVYMFADDARGEGKMHGETNVTFNHTINTKTNSLETMYATPFADEMLTQFAIAAIDAEQLGQGAQPDMLCVSYSSCDGIGHTFGPHSHEIQDEIFRLDRQLEKLFRHLDEKVGLNDVVIVLTADHGVAPTPEFAADMGLDGHRWDSAKFMTNLQTHLEAKFGEGKYFATMKIPYGDVFFRHQTLREKGLAPSVVAAEVREFALSQGFFANAFSREQLLEGRAPGQIGQFYSNGYNAERGADVMLVGKPFGIPGTGKTGTTHGSIYAYDTRVPVLFFGRPFKPGRYADEFYITDIAATLSAALRIEEPPGSIGKPLVRALADQ
jgi:predicted AlkP superfamily pyrophosphatase or phosphodiesterase